MKQVWWYIKLYIMYIYHVTSCLRYISGKYYTNWPGFNGVIAEVKGVTVFET